eukprot:3270078-Prymnesium_polylepis.1
MGWSFCVLALMCTTPNRMPPSERAICHAPFALATAHPRAKHVSCWSCELRAHTLRHVWWCSV